MGVSGETEPLAHLPLVLQVILSSWRKKNKLGKGLCLGEERRQLSEAFLRTVSWWVCRAPVLV